MQNSKSKLRRGLLALCVVSLFGLSACNENDNSEMAQVVDHDWIDDSSPTTSDPAPTATPSPIPSATPGQLYTGPAEVGKYVDKFVADALIQGVNVLPDMKNPMLEIRIASLDAYGSSTIGLCETGGGRRRVTFDPDYWNSVSETQRELLAHHEFGHCILYRGHRSDLLATGKYSSVMYPIIMSASTYTNDYEYYQSELFTYGALELGGTEQTHICDVPTQP